MLVSFPPLTDMLKFSGCSYPKSDFDGEVTPTELVTLVFAMSSRILTRPQEPKWRDRGFAKRLIQVAWRAEQCAAYWPQGVEQK